jgi:hypothetical protein
MRALIVAFAFATALWAAEPAAKITSNSSFLLRGKPVPVAGVPSWTALAGDDVTAGESSLMLVFRDGSRAVLAARSQARIEKGSGEQVLFRLVSGAMTLRPAEKPSTTFYNGSTALQAKPAQEMTVSSAPSAEVSTTLHRIPPPPPPGTPRPTSIR